MNLTDILSDIESMAKSGGISTPFIVGGVVRDKLLNKINDIKDIDITTGDGSVTKLVKKVIERYEPHGAQYKVFKDSHVRVFLKNLQLDFSSNFRVPGINYLLKKKGIEDPSIMQGELFSRDFTCNAALMSLDLSSIYDPLGQSVNDINNRILKTCLEPKVTLQYMPRRIIRLINLKARLGFTIDEKLKSFIINNKDILNSIEKEYLISKLGESLKENKEGTIQAIKELELGNKLKELMHV